MMLVVICRDYKFYVWDIHLHCGKKIELMPDGQWLSGRIRYHSGYCFFNENIGDIILEEGMKVNIIS